MYIDTFVCTSCVYITIYIFNNELFKERIASEQATIKDNEWHLHNVNITSETSVRNLKKVKFSEALYLAWGGRLQEPVRGLFSPK